MYFVVFLAAVLLVQVKSEICEPTVKFSIGVMKARTASGITSPNFSSLSKKNKAQIITTFIQQSVIPLGWFSENGEINQANVFASTSQFTNDSCMQNKLFEGFKVCFIRNEKSGTDSTRIMICLWQMYTTICETEYHEDEKLCEYAKDEQLNIDLVAFYEGYYAGKNESDNDVNSGLDDLGKARKYICPVVETFFRRSDCYAGENLLQTKVQDFYNKSIISNNDSVKQQIFTAVNDCFNRYELVEQCEDKACFIGGCMFQMFENVCERV